MKFENGIELDGSVSRILYKDLKDIFDRGDSVGKVIEATELELFNYYTCANYTGIMDFNTFKNSCIQAGAKIIGEGV